MQARVTGCHQITSCSLVPGFEEGHHQGREGEGPLSSFLPGTQLSKNHACNHIPLSTEDLKKRLTLGNADFQVFKRNNNELAAKSNLMI